jgi:hypothetical protein
MSRSRLPLGLACLLAVGVVGPGPGAAASPPQAIEVTVSPTSHSMDLGDSFDFVTEITNTGSAPASGLVAHLNILSFTRGVYVDPEDWSSRRTEYLDPLAGGDSTEITWTVKAVNSGELGAYVTVLATPGPSGGAPPPSVSPTVHLQVAERRDLSPGGVLPLALGIPAVIAVAMAALRLRRRG